MALWYAEAMCNGLTVVMTQAVKEPQVPLPGRLPFGLLAHNPMISVWGVVVLFTTAARLVFHLVTDCSVILCVYR